MADAFYTKQAATVLASLGQAQQRPAPGPMRAATAPGPMRKSAASSTHPYDQPPTQPPSTPILQGQQSALAARRATLPQVFTQPAPAEVAAVGAAPQPITHFRYLPHPDRIQDEIQKIEMASRQQPVSFIGAHNAYGALGSYIVALESQLNSAHARIAQLRSVEQQNAELRQQLRNQQQHNEKDNRTMLSLYTENRSMREELRQHQAGMPRSSNVTYATVPSAATASLSRQTSTDAFDGRYKS
jgi:hypothetical protein